MVDASIGGKVAVNHHKGKNLIGAFYQPWFVLSDIQALSTLPRRELLSGWAEVIKYGLIKDRDFFEFLESNAGSLVEIKQGPVIEAVRRSAAVKAQVVNDDEKEQGTRVILNYGHTIAHGLETASFYNQFLHGEAVSIGMTGAAMLSQRLKLLSHDIVRRQENILKNFQLPSSFTGVDISEIIKAIELDKKNKQGSVRWVLLEDIGKPSIHNEIPVREVADVLKKLKRT
jgi:3-dehydroquinate synthase